MSLATIQLDNLSHTHPIYLQGQFQTLNQTLTVTDPALGSPLAKISNASRDHATQAITATHNAWPAWRTLSARDRSNILLAIATHIEQNAADFATLITRENGKPIAQSKGEVAFSVAQIRWFAEEAPRAYGRIVPHNDAQKRSLVIRQSVGPAAAISPWNFPLMLAVRKVAPALAAGCPVILKPSEVTPLCCVALAESIDSVFRAANLPPGIFQLLTGDAPPLVSEFLANPLIRKVSFTGSTRIGKLLIQQAAQNVTRLSLELGGNAPLIIFDDANLEAAASAAIYAKMRNTGQACNGANRFYVQRKIYDQFVDAYTKKVTSMKVGSGLDPQNEVGPVISDAARTRLLDLIEDATSKGAKLHLGGNKLTPPGPHHHGFFLEPTILTHVPDNARVLTEEIFGPITPIALFDSEAEVLAKANTTPFGLAAYLYTNDLSRALRLSEHLEAGMIALNDGVPTTPHSPFGGMKESGWGRELGTEGLDAYLESKHISIGRIGP